MCDPFHMHNLDAVFTKEQKTEWRREMCPADLSVGTAPNPSHSGASVTLTCWKISSSLQSSPISLARGLAHRVFV